MTLAEHGASALQEYRPLLFSIAYRLLGSATDAEDVLQDAYLRLAASAAAEQPRNPRAYLSTLVSRLCLDQMKSARARREQYVGPWLPQPLLTADPSPLPHEIAEQLEWLSLAALVLLERLSPEERAVLVLHDGFCFGHAEIAEMLNSSQAACRQWLHRARGRVADPRRVGRQPTPAAHQRLAEQLRAACARGDVQGLSELLAEDVTVWSDGGGVVSAALRPVTGRDAVARFFVGLAGKVPADVRVTFAEVNGESAALVWIGGQVSHLFAPEVRDQCIVAVRVVASPLKLAYLRCQLATRTAQ